LDEYRKYFFTTTPEEGSPENVKSDFSPPPLPRENIPKVVSDAQALLQQLSNEKTLSDGERKRCSDLGTSIKNNYEKIIQFAERKLPDKLGSV